MGQNKLRTLVSMAVSLLDNPLISFLTYGASLKYFELQSQPNVTKHDTPGEHQ